MKNETLITAKDIFNGMKAEYLKQDWEEDSPKEFHKKVEGDRVLMIRLDGNYIDMRLSRTGLYTSRFTNAHSSTEYPLNTSVKEFMNQFDTTANKWLNDLSA